MQSQSKITASSLLMSRAANASMADVDRSVDRVLRQKFALGLFERPYIGPERAARIGHSAEAKELAL